MSTPAGPAPLPVGPLALLREAVDRLEAARDLLETTRSPAYREAILREIGAAESSVMRAMHLIGG